MIMPRIALLLASMALAGPAAFAQEPAPFQSGAVNLIGWDGVAQGNHGQLRIDGQGLEFQRDGQAHRIAWANLRRFAIERTSRGLIRGTGGTIASFSPQGAGQLYSAIRPGAQALSLLYADDQQALHAAVVILPANCRDGVLAAFAAAGFQPATVLTLPADDQPGAHFVPAMRDPAGAVRQDVRVAFPRATTDAMPAAYAAELYEATLVQLDRSHRFAAVWRDGDLRTGPSAATVTTTITRVRKGNAGVRGAVPVLGMVIGKTSIEADVRLTDADGTRLFDATVKGSKSMPGESIGASKSFARQLDRSMGRTDRGT
jgi:hypothetical protein